MTSRIIRNMVTLGVGCAFYLTVTLMIEKWDDLVFSLRWLYMGFGLALLWGTLQSLYVVYFVPQYFIILNSLQSLISTRKLFPTRVSGMTFEPKWFAEQICFLLLPWLLGAVITKHSIFRWRYKWITIEWIMLVWSFVIVIFTFSRTGFFLLAVLSIFSVIFYLISRRKGLPHSEKQHSKINKRSKLIIILFLITLLVSTAFIISQNRYASRFWRYWTDDVPGTRSYLEYIGFQQRFVYWITAFRIYETSPILGVGLGNYAFHFADRIPDQPWNRQPEIVRQLTPVEGRDRLITPKNLYARLLAETGLIGTTIFSAFIIALFSCGFYLFYSRSEIQLYWGISGLLGLIVFIFVIFSFDSLAFPNMWVVFALVTSASHLPDP